MTSNVVSWFSLKLSRSNSKVKVIGESLRSQDELETRDVLPNINRTQAAERAEKCRLLLWWPWPLTDLRPWHSNSFERGTKDVCGVDLAQIRSAVPEIFHTQTKNKDWRRQKNRTFRSSLRVVKMLLKYSATSNEVFFLVLHSCVIQRKPSLSISLSLCLFLHEQHTVVKQALEVRKQLKYKSTANNRFIRYPITIQACQIHFWLSINGTLKLDFYNVACFENRE